MDFCKEKLFKSLNHCRYCLILINSKNITDEKKFFSLLRQFNKLNTETPILIDGRILSLDPEESDMLLDSMVTIRNNFHFSERREYIDLAKDFLADQISADDFSSGFMGNI